MAIQTEIIAVALRGDDSTTPFSIGFGRTYPILYSKGYKEVSDNPSTA